MPSLLNPRKTQHQKIIETVQAAQVAGVAPGGSAVAATPRRQARSPSEQIARTLEADSVNNAMAGRTMDFVRRNAAMDSMRGMGMGGIGGGSMLRNKAQGMPGMSRQFAGPGSMLRKKRTAFASPSGI
jgi:hypothetical protein